MIVILWAITGALILLLVALACDLDEEFKTIAPLPIILAGFLLVIVLILLFIGIRC